MDETIKRSDDFSKVHLNIKQLESAQFLKSLMQRCDNFLKVRLKFPVVKKLTVLRQFDSVNQQKTAYFILLIS